jgi:hypothetical protein
MKISSIFALTLLFASSAWATKDLNPADYPITAHVNSAIFTHTTAPSNSRVTELRIGNLIYVSDTICKEAKVGTDYPARINGRWLYLLAGARNVCRYGIDGTKDAH